MMSIPTCVLSNDATFCSLVGHDLVCFESAHCLRCLLQAFLQFSTGCSSLPVGGLANLHPRLTVVRKDEEGGFPSVNTCVHYLKLPEYSSEEVLKERLLGATAEKGFHLN